MVRGAAAEGGGPSATSTEAPLRPPLSFRPPSTWSWPDRGAFSDFLLNATSTSQKLDKNYVFIRSQLVYKPIVIIFTHMRHFFSDFRKK
jgi:hypothetical protein